MKDLDLFILSIDEVLLWVLTVKNANELIVGLDRQALKIDLIAMSQNFIHGLKFVEALTLVSLELCEKVLADRLFEFGLYLEYLK